MPGAKHYLGEYVERGMKLKGLTQKDGEWISGRRMPDGYVGSISIGSAKNLSVDKLTTLGDGIGVGAAELYGRLQPARGR